MNIKTIQLKAIKYGFNCVKFDHIYDNNESQSLTNYQDLFLKSSSINNCSVCKLIDPIVYMNIHVFEYKSIFDISNLRHTLKHSL